MDDLVADNAQLRKQILAYQKDLSIVRKILYVFMERYPEWTFVHVVADRTLNSLKQT